MRGAKSFLILVIVALALGGYDFFVESKREPASSASTKKDHAFTFELDKVEEIQVRAAGGDTTTLKKTGEKWQITAPEALDADESEVSTLVSTLRSLEIQRVLDEAPKAVTQFGLEPVRASVGFRLAGETTMHKLDLGNKTPTGGDLYARVDGQPKILLVSSVRRGLAEQDDVRAPRQERAEVRARRRGQRDGRSHGHARDRLH